MSITSIIAIYFLFFAASAFIMLPFAAVATTDEVGGEKVPGQAESAPHSFDLKRHLARSAILAALLFAIYYANWTYGWITLDDIDFYDPPNAQANR